MAKIFVYGTLRKGGRLNPMMGTSKFLGKGTIPGVLINLGPFPALIDGTGIVVGEVYEVAAKQVEILDRVEGVHAGLYDRRPVTVTQGKEEVKAEAYFFADDAMMYSRGIVPDGDWMAFTQNYRDEPEEVDPGGSDDPWR